MRMGQSTVGSLSRHQLTTIEKGVSIHGVGNHHSRIHAVWDVGADHLEGQYKRPIGTSFIRYRPRSRCLGVSQAVESGLGPEEEQQQLPRLTTATVADRVWGSSAKKLLASIGILRIVCR